MIAEVYISPFQGLVSWRCHFIERCSMLVYHALSGLIPLCVPFSPERASSANDGHSPSDKKIILTSPEGAGGYNSEGITPPAANDGHSPSDKTITSPERA